MKNLPDMWRRDVFDPFREVSRLQRSVARLFSDVLNPTEEARFSGADFIPACDIEETGKSYVVKMDIPGIKKEDLKIELQDDQLVVSGERKEEHEEKDEKGTRYFCERSYGSFYRTFPMPKGVKSDQISANYSDGVLLIEVPKVEAVEPKRITIQEGKTTKKAA